MNKKLLIIPVLAIIAFFAFRPVGIGNFTPPSGGGGGASLGTEALTFSQKAFESGTGALASTGFIRFKGDAALLDSTHNIWINDGNQTLAITFGNFGGGNNQVSGNTTTVDIGGGITGHQIAPSIAYGIALSVEAGTTDVLPVCESWSAPVGGFSINGRCINLSSGGAVTTTIVNLINSNAGSAGNISIVTDSSYFEVSGLSGGAD